MNNQTTSKLYKVFTLNETRTILMYIELTMGQLQEVLPKYIVRILTNERFRLPKDTSVKSYTFRELTIDSNKHYVVELDYTKFMKLFENDNYKVRKKRIEPVVIKLPEPEVTSFPVERPSSKTEKPTHTNNNGDNQRKEKPSYYDGVIRFLKYTLTYRPGNTFYDNERCNRLRA